MAYCASLSALKPTNFVSSTTGFLALVLRRSIPFPVSASRAIHHERTHCVHSPLSSRFGVSNPFRLGTPNPSLRLREARGEAVAPIASSSRDASAADREENDEKRFRWSPRDGFGLYPWDPSWQAMDLDDLRWIQEETITLFTSEGIVKLGGSRTVPPQPTYSEALSRSRRYREEDYMDPKQGLCLGAIFDIAATNGLDMGRRFCVFGFCRSIEMLSDVVEDTVLGQGGEVVVAEKGSTTGLHEKLTMTVAMPALWGVPPAFDVLNSAIRSGGGIVEKTYKKWEFF